MHIEIRIHRPIVLLLVIGGVVWFLSGFMTQPAAEMHSEAPVGGTALSDRKPTVFETEQDIYRLREQQSVLQHRESFLRVQLAALEEEALLTNDPATLGEIRATTADLLALLYDQKSAEKQLLQSLRDLRDAQSSANLASQSRAGIAPSVLDWPVAPLLGISARFHDGSYKARFGMEHEAIDIPVNQGSPIAAAADGVVRTVSDKGMGFNSLVIEHGGGVATLYGHVSEFLVSEGDVVHAGDIVAKSGGRPGTKGAGLFTTGPHLHFEVHVDGTPVNPLGYLPEEE